MGLFGSEFRNVVEWQESDDNVIFYKWHNDEIKKGSRLIIRPGQDAIFLYNGKVEGIFQDEGSFDIASQIIPFLSTLKGFAFGFNSGIRAEVLFVNTKEFTVKWGTKNAVMIPCETLPGGLPVRAFGTFQMKIGDYMKLIDGIAGVKDRYTVEDVKLRVLSILDQLLMKWVAKEGKDMFHLQASAYDIARGMQEDLDMELLKIGINVTGVQIASFNYPQEIQEKINTAASYHMVGDMNRYQQGKMADSLDHPNSMAASMAGNTAGMGFGMAAGMQMAQQMMQGMQQQAAPLQAAQTAQNQVSPQAVGRYCPSCGNVVSADAKFCSGCGQKLDVASFCPSCGAKINPGDKFCAGCGQKLG